MTTAIEILLWAIAIGGVIYLAIEFFELSSAFRHGPRKPVSGAEAMLGRKVVLTRPFEKSESGKVMPGRVRVDGEDWKAEWTSRPVELPHPGAELTIVRVEADSLRLWVK